jgi:sterol desaturase/sphingolipid hydroxylase (fatty acid hydroxylase superfamily)
MTSLYQYWTGHWDATVAWLADHAVIPLLQALHLLRWADDPSEIAGYFLITLIQVALIAGLLRPLESLLPVERWTVRSHTAIDRRYTLIKLFGVLPAFTYVALTALGKMFGGADDDDAGGLVSLAGLFPWFGAHPVAQFLVYYLIYDLVYYVIHRLQHAIPWWWALHSLHHSQRQLSCWSNDRDHYLDDLFESLIVAGVAVLIGVAPTDYALLVLLTEFNQNVSHVNARVRFGPLLDKLLVDPLFHRLHHMQVDPARPNLHNCNFAIMFPLWDIVFGTALYGEAARPTGVMDPTVDADNQRGLLAQQWHTLRRFAVAIRHRAGWRPGDVSFDENYVPSPVTHHEAAPMAAGTERVHLSYDEAAH